MVSAPEIVAPRRPSSAVCVMVNWQSDMTESPEFAIERVSDESARLALRIAIRPPDVLGICMVVIEGNPFVRVAVMVRESGRIARQQVNVATPLLSASVEAKRMLSCTAVTRANGAVRTDRCMSPE